ncbi:MAG: hypothetical protein DME87_07675, partial [Verrucomicrobia bacterium]
MRYSTSNCAPNSTQTHAPNTRNCATDTRPERARKNCSRWDPSQLSDFDPLKIAQDESSRGTSKTAREARALPREDACASRQVAIALRDIASYIDWSPFFHVWELRGRYPAIFDDPVIGKQARELFDDAQKLLDEITAKNLLTARGVYAFWPANSVGDDVDL